MQSIPDAFALPLPQASPACHATAEAEFLRQVFPWDAGHQNEQDAIEGGAVVTPRPASLGRALRLWYQWLEFLPEFLADQGSLHPRHDAAQLCKFPVLLATLSAKHSNEGLAHGRSVPQRVTGHVILVRLTVKCTGAGPIAAMVAHRIWLINLFPRLGIPWRGTA